jgi:hypothetical protein
MQLHEKLETLNCRRDELARRVLNVSPDTIANISAANIKAGITLEDLSAVNVPVFRYDTQVTIHGLIPDLPNDSNLYTVNGNGSVGIRYGAIDKNKKDLLQRCAKVSKTSWHVHRNSTEFMVYHEFLVKDETQRTAQKSSCLEVLRSIPRGLFFGSAGAFSLAYGMGYAATAHIGGVPEEHVWNLAQFFFCITDLAMLETLEAEKKAKRDAEMEQWRKECEQAKIQRELAEQAKREELAEFLRGIALPRLSTVPRLPCRFAFYSTEKSVDGAFIRKTVELAKRGPHLCARVSPSIGTGWKKVKAIAWKQWDAAAAAGKLFTA